ncbi:MAG: radical SAM protein [Acutalibacteraceae bacterium]|nr:radical SAM protein [Acutalibacteraceae bacterium]
MYSRVYVEITNTCNMNCSFCHGTKRVPKRMSVDEFTLILKKIKPHTNYIYYHLLGEPLTHPELESFIRLATDMGFKSVITTNGTLLKSKGRILIEQKVHKVSISLHSFEGNDSDLHQRYLSEVADFAKQANHNGTIVVLRLWNNGCDNGKNGQTIEFIKNNISGEWTKNTKGIRIRDRLFLEYGDRFGWPDKDADIQGDIVFCYGLRDHFGILCDGTVVPCCLDSEGCINLGNIFTENIEDILSNPRATAMVNGFNGRQATEDLCRRCAYAQRFK